ncbi:phage tail protein [Lysobacter tyrosinilyticus]
MTEPFIGEIQLFGFNFNPRGWAFCNGATLPIAQNTALFSLLGTQYGGNGQTTFQLPNFASRAGCEQGQAPGLTPRTIGETFGTSSVTLTNNEIPSHNHTLTLFSQSDASKRASSPSAGNALSSVTVGTTLPFLPPGTTNTQFAPNMISPFNGGGLPHENEQPYLGTNFCIALQGVFPSFG